jgi:hypothetical protein
MTEAMEKRVREGARRRRRPLRAAASALELAVAAPGGTGPKWCHRVHTRVKQVSAALEGHVVEVEGPSGLWNDIRVHAPRLIPMMDALKAEHHTLRQMVAQLIEDLTRITDKASKEEIAAVREKVVLLLGRITRHRQKGADLVYEAYNVDIGGE